MYSQKRPQMNCNGEERKPRSKYCRFPRVSGKQQTNFHLFLLTPLLLPEYCSKRRSRIQK
jgi:hypothetical protein